MLNMEREILKELGFEIFRICEVHPHRMLYHYLNIFKTDLKNSAQGKEIYGEFVKKSFSYLNDSFKIGLCLQFPVGTIVAACIYLSFCVL
jgi:hypothetical protein